ncbi:MAG TPA: ferrous iron transport protein B [Polyangia bacterium]|nr:ferrous iron transport protein B [Polyangia bacterium]
MSTAIRPDHREPVAGQAKLVLVGAPNVGKSALFGRLTGIYAVVSNYPGTSVEITRGRLVAGGRDVDVMDTPGMYSLLPVSEEERVARRAALSDDDHTIIHVIEAAHLERSLPVTLQLLSLGRPVVVACNLLDEARREHREPDLAVLSERLGIPVVGTVATTGEGIEDLLKAALDAQVPVDGWSLPEPFSPLVKQLAQAAGPAGDGGFRLRAELALSGDEACERIVRRSSPAWAEAAAARDQRWGGAESFAVAVATARRRMALALLDGVVPPAGEGEARARLLDRLAMSPWTGLPLVALVLYLGFYKFVGGFGAQTAVDWLDRVVFTRWIAPVAAAATALIPWATIRALVNGPYGLINLGLRYAFAIVLPIVTAFFLVFALLEDSGYLPRLALLLDRALKKVGLSGRAVIPLVLGFGCNTMATLVTRTLETRRERVIATLLLALAIPCSAQLGVVLGILSAWPGAVVVWGLVLVLVFLLVGRLAALFLPGAAPSFYLELPRMRWPTPANVLRKTGARVRWYFAEILPLFLLASVLLWAGDLTGVLGWATAALVPLVRLIGLPAQAAPAFLYGFFRRDFGAAGLYDLAHRGLLSPAALTTAAVTITLFVPCIAQFLVMKKERGLKVAVGVLVAATTIAFTVGGLVGWLLRAVGGWA